MTDQEMFEKLCEAPDALVGEVLPLAIAALSSERAKVKDLQEEYDASVQGYEIACDILTQERDAAREQGLREGLERAANWCGRQASALAKLDREPEKHAAFAEARNAILNMIREGEPKP